jgi:hypothetical protein
MTFKETLNTVIPWIIGIGGVYLLYKPLAEPLSGLFRGLGSLLRWGKNKVTGDDEEETPSNTYQTVQFE